MNVMNANGNGESIKQKMQQKWAVRAALGILVSIWGRWRFCHCGADGDTELMYP
jgi:hypothetical protein